MYFLKKKRNNKQREIFVPERELTVEFARSSGPGGQNVNKTSTKAIVRWNIGSSSILSSEEKNTIKDKLKNKINNVGELVVYCQEHRSQMQNKLTAISVLRQLVNNALRIKIPRIKTRPRKSAIEKRISAKKIIAEKKKFRAKVEY